MVTIVSPSVVESWKVAGSKPLITTSLVLKYVGQFIGLKLRFPKLDPYRRMVRGNITLFIALIYHHVDEIEHEKFNEVFNSILTSIPKSDESIGEYDINSNEGVRKKVFTKLIGPFVLGNSNKKGQNLLEISLNNNLKIVNSLFNEPTYTTWKYFGKTRSLHMLDIITISSSFFKHIRYCHVSQYGMRSDQSAIKVVFLNRSSKVKHKRDKQLIIDWKRIQNLEDVNVEFNFTLSENLKRMDRYTNYNELILKSAELIVMHMRFNNQGWYHHSRDRLKPVMDNRNSVLHNIRIDKTNPSKQTVKLLR